MSVPNGQNPPHTWFDVPKNSSSVGMQGRHRRLHASVSPGHGIGGTGSSGLAFNGPSSMDSMRATGSVAVALGMGPFRFDGFHGIGIMCPPFRTGAGRGAGWSV